MCSCLLACGGACLFVCICGCRGPAATATATVDDDVVAVIRYSRRRCCRCSFSLSAAAVKLGWLGQLVWGHASTKSLRFGVANSALSNPVSPSPPNLWERFVNCRCSPGTDPNMKITKSPALSPSSFFVVPFFRHSPGRAPPSEKGPSGRTWDRTPSLPPKRPRACARKTSSRTTAWRRRESE